MAKIGKIISSIFPISFFKIWASSFHQGVLNTCSFILQYFGGCVTKEIVYQCIACTWLFQWNYVVTLTFSTKYTHTYTHILKILGDTIQLSHSSKDSFGLNSYSEETLSGSSRSFFKCLRWNTLWFSQFYFHRCHIQMPFIPNKANIYHSNELNTLPKPFKSI